MQQTEIRLFGGVWVRRSDGTVVRPADWRTTKTLDLLRLLALDPHMSVPVTRIRSLLWPDSDEIHAGASLRTATSQLRKVLGPHVVERQSASLALRQAWVDVHRYAGVLDEADRARRRGDDPAVVALVRQADALYAGDIEADETSGDWLRSSSALWLARHAAALVDGADAAARLRWMRDCVDLAERAVRLEPHSEEAVRAQIRGLAGLGRTAPALTAYERLRNVLAEQFGVDPAPQTRALHLQLLRAGRPAPQSWPVKHPATAAMVDALARLRRSGADRGVLWVSGPSGSGRVNVVKAACSELGLPLHSLDGAGAPVPSQRTAAADLHRADAVVLLHGPWDCAGGLPGALAGMRQAIVVVPVEPGDLHDLAGLPGAPAEKVDVVCLSRNELRSLAGDMLQAEPSETLVDRLCADTGSLAGLAQEQLVRWLDGGDLVWTPDGMNLATGEAEAPASSSIAHVLHRLPDLAADVLVAVATADGILTEDQIESLLDDRPTRGRTRLREALDSLLDAGLLTASPAGVQLTDRTIRAQIVGWVRPSVRHRLEQKVALLLGRHLGLAPPQVADWVS
jgi:DNA-binding SARP family transcriptional activator